MDFLFDNPLANMPGVIFLVFYSLFIVFSLVIFGVWKTQADKTAKLAVPPIPTNVDPYEIAYLRGGMNEVARAAIFALRQKDFLIFQNEGKNSRIHRNQQKTDRRGLDEMEQDVLKWFGTSREPQEIFQGYGLTQALDRYYGIYESRLEQQQLLTDDETRSRIKRARNIVLLLILGLGAYKFTAALLHGYANVLGIVGLAAISTLIIFAVAKVSRLTALGKIYLERLQIAFDKLQYQSERQGVQTNTASAQFAGVDPLLLGVGIFGGTILAGTVYDDYNQAFQRAQNQAFAGSSSGSSCGSGCSSSSGGDGGGGDGGGGCGGGCGGCGGGCS
jgi:uncharacterized protein (TIGR04222 family)